MATANLPAEEIEALKQYCASISAADESSITYLLLAGLKLPNGCAPASVDALLCLGERDGYPTRLYFAERVDTPSKVALNWNASGVRILERNWHAYSYKAMRAGTLVELLVEHLKPLQ